MVEPIAISVSYSALGNVEQVTYTWPAGSHRAIVGAFDLRIDWFALRPGDQLTIGPYRTAFEGQPFELTGLKLRLGPVPVSFFIPVPQDGRTWAVVVEVRAAEKGEATARSESGSAGAGGDA